MNDKKNYKNLNEKDIKFILQLFNSKKIFEAKKEVNKKINLYPNSSILQNILGAILAEEKQLDAALESYRKAIKIDPNYAQAYNNLGTALQKLNRVNEAIDNYKKAISLKTNFAEAFHNLGIAMATLNNSKEALQFFEKALQIKSDYAEVYNSLGNVHEDLGNQKKAIENYEKAIKFKADYFSAYNNLGNVLKTISKFDEAISSYNKAIKIKPDYEKVHNNLGNLLNDLGKHDEAIKSYKQAIKIKPDDASVYSNLLLCLIHSINFDPKLYLLEAKKFRLNCKSIKKNLSFKYCYKKNPKKLRLGFVSSDFGNHPGGYFTLSTLVKLNKKNFDMVAYSNFDRKDELAKDFLPLFSKWNSIAKKNDYEVVKQIFEDGIHILIDLQGHTAFNRLPIFMYKAAPIQVTWLGQGSTGIPEIDYFIGSRHITPKSEDKNYLEKVIRLPEISQCFTEPNLKIKVKSLPAIKNNFITFGCFNKLSKLNDEVIRLWSQILLSVPKSKLFLKSKEFDSQKICINSFEKFNKNNVSNDRLIFRGKSKTRKELLESYNEIDIALDPFPFQGNTNTCEAAWMGVPVITLKGDRHVFHFGESINFNLNMHDWIAQNHNEYISKAIKFSSNIKQLTKVRKELRETALKSKVFDASNFSEHFEKSLWNMWKEYNNQK